MSPEVSVIIVNWHSSRWVQQCLSSLFRHCRGSRIEVIVVDNASFDGCDTMLAREFPGVRVVQSGTNLGFGGANNLGAGHATGQFLLLLNPDTEFVEDAIGVMVRTMRATPRAGAVGCVLLNSDGTVQLSCVQPLPTLLNQFVDAGLLRARFPAWRIWGPDAARLAPDSVVQVEAISGACMLLRRDVFEAVGGFRPDFFMYGEDLDLCARIGRAGWKVYVTSGARLIHHGGGSTRAWGDPRASVTMRAAVHRYFRLNHGVLKAMSYRVAMAVASSIRLGLLGALILYPRKRWVADPVNAARKWGAILRWSLGIDGAIRR